MTVVAFRDKSQMLAEQNGWSLGSAKGYVDGEIFRKRCKEPPLVAVVGIDDYSEGFRAHRVPTRQPGAPVLIGRLTGSRSRATPAERR